MTIYSFYNNKSTTLSGTLNNTDTTLLVSILTSDIIAQIIPVTNKLLLTLTNTAETSIEIIEAISTNGTGPFTSYNIVRGVDGTSPQTWPSGTKIGFRLPKAILQSFPQNKSIGNNVSVAETTAKTAVRAGASGDWAASTAVSEGDVKIWRVSTVPTWAYYYIKGGTTGSVGDPEGTQDTIIDGTAIRVEIPIDSLGNFNISNRLNIGSEETNKSLFFSASIGNNNVAFSNEDSPGNGIVIGENNKNIGANTVIGGTSSCYSLHGSIVLGESQTSVIDKSFLTSAHPSKEININPVDNNGIINGGLEGIVWSPILDFTGGAAWTASTQIRHGHVRRPTSANGFQYLRVDNTWVNIFAKHTSLYSTFSTTGGTQPTWPTTQNNTVNDGNGYWIANPNVGLTLTFPSLFIPKEVGIVVYDYSAITVQPSISFGKSGNNTLYKADAQTTNLTAANKVQLYSINSTEASTTFTISINTLATGTLMLGQVFVRGTLCPRWY